MILESKVPPSLEMVNTRLNIFRAKIEKVNFLELLEKEIDTEKDPKKMIPSSSINKTKDLS